MMSAWGCGKPSEAGFVYDLGGEKTTICPISMLRGQETQQALSLFAFYKKSITPNGRGLRHETSKYRQTMVLLENLSAEAEHWYSEQSKKDTKKV